MADDATRQRRKKYHHGDLREALLRAAERELAEKGLESFTLRGVAKRAGVSHAAPAHHFRDTNALLTALVTVAMQRFGSAMTSAMSQAGDDARARFVASGIAYVEFALENPSLFDLIFSSRRPDFDDPELTRQAATAFGSLVDGIAALIGADPMASPGGRVTVAAAWSQVHGVATLLNAGKMKFLAGDLAADRKAALRKLVSSVLPVAPTSAD
ncbi:MAG: TetR/AcrR family transcriptional regulator [Rhizobiaceae bacterium]|nr:TetR/AcrR family transcriptional regulator [Rhizobiaceae bacterium]